jgi:hypothetical protein
MNAPLGNWTQLRDTLLNMVTGLGTPKDPRMSSQYHLHVLDRHVLENMYRSDWLARKIVDAPAEDATRQWRTWQVNKDQLKPIEQIERKFQIQRKMREALIRARLYGGGAMVLGVDQGQPEDELVLEDIGKNELQFVVVLNRYELSAGPRIYNVDSPYYTRPEYYTVATPMFGFFGEQGGAYPSNKPGQNQLTATSLLPSPQGRQGGSPPLSDPNMRVQPDWGMVRIHPSRVVEFNGNELPDWRLAPMGGGWGDSVLQTVEEALKDFGMIIGGLANLINDMKMDVVKIPELSRKLSTVDLTNKVMQRFGLANQMKSGINTLLLDSEEEWQRIQTAFSGTPELIEIAMKVACAAGGIPESRAMGSAPNRGLDAKGGSGGEVDIRNYYDSVASDQETRYRPKMLPLDVAIARSALGNAGGDAEYVWNKLYEDTPAEKAAVALQKAQATQVYVSMGLFNEDMFRQAVGSQLADDETYPGWDDAVEEFGLEPEEPPQQTMPVPPPGMMNKGAFEPNPFHMMRAQGQLKSGQPMRVPPNDPRRALPAPNQRDAWEDGCDLSDDRWVTVHPHGPGSPGQAVKISSTGEIEFGLGGRFTGRKISELRQPTLPEVHRADEGEQLSLPLVMGAARDVGSEAQVRAAADAGARIGARALDRYTGQESEPTALHGPAGVYMFDAGGLKTDAARFQYKAESDKEGVTTALKGVTKWDPSKANQIIAWEDRDGQVYVVDGHQRAALARRLLASGAEKAISLPGILYRAKDGVTAEDVRAIAAAKNIAEGSGSPIDGAKVLRSRPELMDGSMPVSRTEARQAFDLAALNPTAFGMVVNEVVPYQHAAVVGRLIPKDEDRQNAAMKAIARFEPRNETEAQVLVQRVAQAELDKAVESAQTSMFGLEEPESTAGEEMRIVAKAIGALKSDRSLFARVVSHAERIEETGSVVKREAARSVAQESEMFIKRLTSEAYSRGPVRSELTKAARDVKNGDTTVSEAVQRILAALRGESEADVSSGAGHSGGSGGRLAL